MFFTHTLIRPGNFIDNGRYHIYGYRACYAQYTCSQKLHSYKWHTLTDIYDMYIPSSDVTDSHCPKPVFCSSPMYSISNAINNTLGCIIRLKSDSATTLQLRSTVILQVNRRIGSSRFPSSTVSGRKWHRFFASRVPFVLPNQWCEALKESQSTDGLVGWLEFTLTSLFSTNTAISETTKHWPKSGKNYPPLDSFFLHPPQDFWETGHCFLFDGSPAPETMLRTYLSEKQNKGEMRCRAETH